MSNLGSLNTNFLTPLYYISQGGSPLIHLQNIENVCRAGVRLVQLRMKNIDEQLYLETAIEAKQICNKYNTTLIINDNIEVAKKVGVGVHLGKEDESIGKAKTVLENVLIGGTANTLTDCLELIDKKVDYIGLGPFKFTETKKKLSPILGEEGYRKIINELKKQGHTIPIYAIGGIIEDDFNLLFDVGVYGIAVSGLLSSTNEKTVKRIVDRCVR